MLAVLAYHSGDQDLARNLALWMAELGGCKGHRLLLLRDASAEQIGEFSAVFDDVNFLTIADDKWRKWPESPNHAFAVAAKFIPYKIGKVPFLWLEPDICPLSEGWMDAIAEEYKAKRKPFLGDFVDVKDVPKHMSGIAVYPSPLTHYAGLATIAHEIAWDVAAAQQIVPKMAKSECIMHSWKHPEFKSLDEVQREIFDFKSKCCLFHADKAGSLIKILRAERKPAVLVLAEPETVKVRPKSSIGDKSGEARESTKLEADKADSGLDTRPDSRGGGQTFDILIKSYPPDYERLNYCLRSIEKFATGFREVRLILPQNKEDGFSTLSFRFPISITTVVENGDGYLFQQAVKANAHEFTDADYILHVDSDMIFTRPFTPENFMRDGKPLWLMTPYEHLRESIETLQQANAGFHCGVMTWKSVTEKFLGEPVEFEFMRRLPLLIPRSLHLAAATFCRAKHAMRLTDYILSQPNKQFSEFNALGALAYNRAWDDFSWLDTTKEPLPELVATQYWSQDPLTDEVRAQFEEILGNNLPAAPVPAKAEGSARMPVRVGTLSDAREEHHLPPAEKQDSFGGGQSIHQTKEGWWVIDGDTHISKWVEETGRLDHDQNTLPVILPEIEEGDIVIDAGANIGSHTIAYLNKVGPSGKVLAIEPNPVALDCLRRNCPSAATRQAALWEKNGVMLRLETNENSGASHVVEDPEGNIKSATLDHLVKTRGWTKRIAFIKLDVEGCELHALRGAEKTIAASRPKLLIEVNEAALEAHGSTGTKLLAWLGERGYYPHLVQENLSLTSPQFDVLCIPTLTAVDVLFKAHELIGDLHPPREVMEECAPNLARLDRIRDLCTDLATFCGASQHTFQVRQELAAAGIIPAVKRKRRKRRKAARPS